MLSDGRLTNVIDNRAWEPGEVAVQIRQAPQGAVQLASYSNSTHPSGPSLVILYCLLSFSQKTSEMYIFNHNITAMVTFKERDSAVTHLRAGHACSTTSVRRNENLESTTLRPPAHPKRKTHVR